MRKKGFMTIGYGNMGEKDLVNRIKKLRVNCIIDVRTRPYSKYNVSFNKEELRERLSDAGISYFWFGNKLGAKYDRIKYCDEKGRVDYDKVAQSETFIEGIKELEKMITRYNVCVLDSRQDPLKSHRFLLISRHLKKYNIHHIMPDGSLIKNEELEKQMLELYGNLNQVSLLDNHNAESVLDRVYKEQSLKSAYVSEKVITLLSQGIKEDEIPKTKVYCIGTKKKSAETFFELLKKHKIKKVVDLRDHIVMPKVAFAKQEDISYYLKLNGIEYEKYKDLVPSSRALCVREFHSLARYLRIYEEEISGSNSLLSLISDGLEGVCFLGYEEDYKKCHRNVLIKQLKKLNPNITVRHLK